MMSSLSCAGRNCDVSNNIPGNLKPWKRTFLIIQTVFHHFCTSVECCADICVSGPHSQHLPFGILFSDFKECSRPRFVRSLNRKFRDATVRIRRKGQTTRTKRATGIRKKSEQPPMTKGKTRKTKPPGTRVWKPRGRGKGGRTVGTVEKLGSDKGKQIE